MHAFSLNQIVKGANAGTFVIVGFRTIGGELHAQVKEYDATACTTLRGEFALPLSALTAM